MGAHNGNTFVVVPAVTLGLFDFSDRLLSIAVSGKVTFQCEVLFSSMLVFAIFLILCFKCYWRVVPFGERLKGNVGFLCGGILREACRVVGKESSACEFSFGLEMEIETAVSITSVSVTMQDLHSSTPGWKLSVRV